MIPNMGKKTVDIFADNLSRNCAPGQRFETITDLAKKAGLGSSTIDRLKKGQSSVRLENLGAVSSAYGLSAWQFLVPNMDAKRPPKLQGDGLSPDAAEMLDIFNKLSGPERKGILATAQAILEAHEDIEPRKRPASA